MNFLRFMTQYLKQHSEDSTALLKLFSTCMKEFQFTNLHLKCIYFMFNTKARSRRLQSVVITLILCCLYQQLDTSGSGCPLVCSTFDVTLLGQMMHAFPMCQINILEKHVVEILTGNVKHMAPS